MADTPFRLIKLGGAAITNKSVNETLDHEVLSDTCRKLSSVICEGTARYVIVHGAGSFGHQLAHAAGLVRGHLDSPVVRSGIVDTRQVLFWH
jgi:isopentenyl phosphate kinase